ncbi:3-oxoacid CoA-transferase subunit A [Paracoccus pantotrophus]|uniref:3-oxoacid CoA-transferase subunit A n=1 Tax=Paracoccus pantotrophus TaxID=82367 RepID=A0A7H9BSZ6_PARPN|nr:3-oxoacid CoA-transferase subunit A [Paracoccus pantotrophus]QLH14173.1 3-oxoacid CoA-transferase subunit A [Paracoccus pantotrophus]
MKGALTPAAAAELVPDGASIMIGSFMGVGTPERMIDALVARNVRGLTVIANDTAMPGRGIGKLISAGAVSALVTSHIGLNPETQAQMIDGSISVELVPQGTLVERIRAGGMGLGGALTPTGLGTEVENGKQVIEVDGARFLVERPLRADFALLAAWQADYVGNLSYLLTAHNFNPMMALAGATVIAEPNAIVPVGVIPPDAVKTPGVLVDHLLVRANAGGQTWMQRN